MANMIIIAILAIALVYLVHHFARQLKGISTNTGCCSGTCQACREDSSANMQIPPCHTNQTKFIDR